MTHQKKKTSKQTKQTKKKKKPTLKKNTPKKAVHEKMEKSEVYILTCTSSCAMEQKILLPLKEGTMRDFWSLDL